MEVDDRPCALAMLTDVTELEATREDLARSEARWHLLVERHPEPIVVERAYQRRRMRALLLLGRASSYLTASAFTGEPTALSTGVRRYVPPAARQCSAKSRSASPSSAR